MPDAFSSAELAILMAELNIQPGIVDADAAGALQIAPRALYLAAYNEMCETVTGEAPLPLPPDEAEFSEWVLAFLREKGDAAYQAICVRFKYCDRMDRIEWFSIPLVQIMVVAGLLSGYFGWGIAASAWLLATGLLDKLCGCKKRTAKRRRGVVAAP